MTGKDFSDQVGGLLEYEDENKKKIKHPKDMG
jgi:hypothetical protein